MKETTSESRLKTHMMPFFANQNHSDSEYEAVIRQNNETIRELEKIVAAQADAIIKKSEAKATANCCHCLHNHLQPKSQEPLFNQRKVDQLIRLIDEQSRELEKMAALNEDYDDKIRDLNDKVRNAAPDRGDLNEIKKENEHLRYLVSQYQADNSQLMAEKTVPS